MIHTMMNNDYYESNNDNDDDDDDEENYDTTVYTQMLQQQQRMTQYPAAHTHIPNRTRTTNSRNYYHHASYAFAGRQTRRRCSSIRRQWGIRLIQQQWRRGVTMTTTSDDSKTTNEVIGWNGSTTATIAKNDEFLDNREKKSDDDDDEGTNICCHDDKRQKQRRRKRGGERGQRAADYSDSFLNDESSFLLPYTYYHTAVTSSSSSSSSSSFTTNAAIIKQATTTTTTTTLLRIQPTLLFRRTNANLDYYSNTRYYTNIQFLNPGHHQSSVVIGVDNYGDLDIVRVPLLCSTTTTSSFGGRRGRGGGYYYNDSDDTSTNHDDDDDDEKEEVGYGGGGGIGTLQADRMPIIISNDINGGPRQQPMDNNSHYEIYGYDNGSKFAVGLRSGRVQLFTTERAAAAAAAADRGAPPTSTSSFGATSTNALWSCLPSSTTTTTIGPRRRYRANDRYTLSSMLSNTTNKTNLFDAYNTSFLEEISDWDSDNINLHPNHLPQGDGYPWAFRELNATALMGAFVDVENGDCFSIRVMDERQQLSNNGNGSSSSPSTTTTTTTSASAMNVVVVDNTRNAPSSSQQRRLFNGTSMTERVHSVCFSGEYGLVTSHSTSPRNNDTDSNLTATSIKWWDHRMLRSHQPVNSMCLSFPRDNVSLLSPDVERYLVGAPSSSSLLELSMEQLFLDGTTSATTYFGPLHVNRLVGARDSSDRFAIHLKSCSNSANPNQHHHDDEVVLMVDSCRGEITQQIRYANFGGLSPSISSYLDTMACFTRTKEGDEEQCISIFDVSRYRTDDVASNRHDPYEYLSGKKRQLRNDVSGDEIMCGEGLLQRLSPKVQDMYGIRSSLTCMSIDDYGATIACGTSDGDMFILNSSDLGLGDLDLAG